MDENCLNLVHFGLMWPDFGPFGSERLLFDLFRARGRESL